jgi:hypothetical protein
VVVVVVVVVVMDPSLHSWKHHQQEEAVKTKVEGAPVTQREGKEEMVVVNFSQEEMSVVDLSLGDPIC